MYESVQLFFILRDYLDKDPVSTGEAIQKLRETEEMLMKKQVGLDKKYVQRY